MVLRARDSENVTLDGLSPKQRLSGQTLRPPVGGGASEPTFLQARTNTQPLRPIAETPEQRPQLSGDRMAAGRRMVESGGTGIPAELLAGRPGSVPAPAGHSGAEAVLRDRAARRDPIDIRQTGSVIEDALANPSGFNTEVFNQSLNRAFSDIDAAGREATGNLEADAARRGVFFGSPLTTRKGDLASEMQRARTGAATDLLMRQAETLGSDRSRAIGDAMSFGREARQSDRDRFNAALQMLGTASGGGPSLQQILQNFSGLGLAQGSGIPPGLFEMLGQLGG